MNETVGKQEKGESLASKHCTPCEKGTPPLEGERLAALEAELGEGWSVQKGHHLRKEFIFDDFRQALEFTKQVGEIAEAENHHPLICFTWGKAEIKIFTHAIDGLSENDFILAAKIDQQTAQTAQGAPS